MTAEELVNTTVTDSYGQSHIIKSVIGQGGQGIVCLSETSGFVIKFVTDESGNLISSEKNPEEYNRYKQMFRKINLNPFPARLHLAYPIAVIQEYAGYVMRLMEDMIPFGKIIPNGGFENFAEIATHRRRFEYLSKIAHVLGELHASGMVYCDISPNNIFVTSNPKSKIQNVWFIDADNVFVPSENQAKIVYTPRYAAPELINKGKSCSQNSDVYSFAVMAFECLFGIHPFAGNKINGDAANDDDWDASTKVSKKKESSGGWSASTKKSDGNETSNIDLMYSGKIPWIEDTEDNSNKTEDGLPRQNFLNTEFFRLFNKIFSGDGRESPASRPTIYFWEKEFAKASDLSVVCPKCGMSHIYDSENKNCPWCDEALPPVFKISKGDDLLFAHEMIETNFNEPFEIPDRIFSCFSQGTWNSSLQITVEKLKDEFVPKISKTNYADGSLVFELENPDKIGRQKISGSIWLLSKENKFILHCTQNGKTSDYTIEVRK